MLLKEKLKLYVEHLKGFYKVDTDYRYSLKEVTLFNPTTKEEKKIIVDDTDYDYMQGLISREYPVELLEFIRFNLEINEEVRNSYLDYKKIFRIGSKVNIIKGRKEKGNKGVVKKLWDYKDRYNRFIALYSIVETEDGKEIKINTSNLEII